MEKKKIVYIDMDNTLADYAGLAKKMHIDPNDAKHLIGFFRNLDPMPGAIDAYEKLSKHFDVYILTTAPWSNPQSFAEKLEWIKKYLPKAYKNVIFSHHKELNIGDYLIDDSLGNGASEFNGEHIQIGNDKFPDWDSVISYICNKEKIYF